MKGGSSSESEVPSVSWAWESSAGCVDSVFGVSDIREASESLLFFFSVAIQKQVSI